MSNNQAREELKLLYGARCMLTDSTENLTYHHIRKRSDGGEATVNNGALLDRVPHTYLHDLERTNRNLYEEINEALQCYKVCLEWEQEEGLEIYEDVKRLAKKEIYRY